MLFIYLLNNYFSEETYNFENKCLKFGKILPHNKKDKISRIPSILMLSLRRMIILI